MPVADRLEVKEPVVVIGPPAKLTNVELLVDIDVTVPMLFAASIDATIWIQAYFLLHSLR